MGHWVPMAERQGGTIPAVALSQDFLTDRQAFVASNAGVFRSKDAGKSWEFAGDGLDTFAAQSIALSPRFPRDRTLFAGTIDGGVYRSTDGGDSWTLLSRQGTGSGVVALGVASSEPGDLVVMAGTLADGVFVSTNGGEVFEPRNSGLPDLSVIGLALSPAFAGDQTAYVATENGLQMTTNGGDSWRQVWSGGEDDTIQCTAISPAFATDGTLFIGTERQGVLISRDRGKNWRPASTGLPDLLVFALVLSPSFESDRTVVAATGRGISRSIDGGESWTLVAERSEIILSLAASSATNEQVLLAGLAGGGVIRSEDGGMNWESTNRGLTAAYLVDLALSPHVDSDGTIFAWGPSDGVFRSDGGRSWQPTWKDMEGVSVASMALSPSFSTDGTLYVGTSAGIFRSEDRGQSWSRLGLANQAISLLALPSSRDKATAIFAIADNALRWSEDSGASWQEISLPADDQAPVALKTSVDEAGEQLLLLATWQAPGIYGRGRLRVWSRELGDAPWKLRFSGTSDTGIAVLGVPDSFGGDQKFFIGNGEAVYRIAPNTQERTRDGVTPLWLGRRVGERDRTVVSLATSPDFARSHTLIAAVGEGVYLSEDDGNSWNRLGGTLGTRLPIAVAPSPDYLKTGSIYALTMGGTLWKWEPGE